MSLGQFMPDFDTNGNFQSHLGVIGSVCSCSWCFQELQRKVNYGQFEAVCQIFRKQFNGSCFDFKAFVSPTFDRTTQQLFYYFFVSYLSICCIYLSIYLEYEDGD